MPICKSCLQDKKQSEFYKHSKMPSWYLNFCKECKKQYARTNRSKEKDKLRYWSNPKRRLNAIYHWIMSRCYNKNNTHYKWYWAKGIKVLWCNYKEFYQDMCEEYIKHWTKNGRLKNRQTQIDRIDNNWHYCKENCRWITAKDNNEYNKI